MILKGNTENLAEVCNGPTLCLLQFSSWLSSEKESWKFMEKFAMLHRKQVSGEIQQVTAVNVSTKGK